MAKCVGGGGNSCVANKVKRNQPYFSEHPCCFSQFSLVWDTKDVPEGTLVPRYD